MAASMCKKRHKNVGLCVSFAIITLCIVPLCDTFSIQTEELRLNIPHNADVGFIVMKTDLKETCLIVDHIQKHRSQVINPFTVSSNGYLVTKSSIVDNIGDLFIFHPKSTESCRNKTVSQSFPVHVEITHDRDCLGFFYDRYEGSVSDDAPANTKVQSIEHLYACSVTTCRNNLDYRILGSDEFYLKTVSKDDHIELEIYTKRPAAVMKNIESLILVGQNADGQQGHTNIEVKLVHDADDNLYFVPILSHRHKRDTPDVLPLQQVAENATGVLFTLPSPPAGQTYTLVSSTYRDAFTVSSVGTVSVSQGFTLDYETLTADGGSSTVQLGVNRIDADNAVVKELRQDIEVTDVNDEPPRFTNTPTPFLAAVNPNAQANILVYSLTAVDPDAGGDLLLEVDPQTTVTNSRVNQFFSINLQGNKADILRRGSDPFNENEIFNVYFIATDQAAPVGTSQRTTAHVEIKAGRREPQFMKTNYVLQFQENNAINQDISPTTPIEVFTFQDRPIIFEVRNMNDQPSTVFTARSEISNNQIKGCKITIGRVMDYEKGPREYNVTLRAIEEETGLYSEKLVQIFVTDKNEFQPTFTKSAYTKDNVPENTAAGTILLTVTSTDEDYNTLIKFSVDNDLFRVEAVASGSENVHLANIIVDGDLDYDFISPKNYEFNVFAADDGAISKTGRATIQIFMLDVNDEAPQFPVDPMTTPLRYDANVGQEVFYVFASDADSGDKVTYQFTQTYEKFSLNADTGRIVLTKIIAPSQELIDVFKYELGVIAVDDGGCCGKANQLRTTGTVTVNILTYNEHRPVFENCNTYSPSVNEEVAGAFVIRVQATDADYGDFGVVTYSIRDVDSKFRINSTTGDLYTKVPIDRETDLVSSTKLVVNVVGTDGGNSENVCSLLVLIKDVNDNDPIFTLSSYDVTITNLLIVDKVAAYIEAKDKDIQNNSRVIYSFAQSGNPGEYFKFDDPSYIGQIKVAKELPQQQDIELTVIATDMGTPPRHSNATVNIKITMPTDNQPPGWIDSTPQGFTVSVLENVTIRTNVMQFRAKSNVPGNTDLTFKTIYAENEEEIFSAQVSSILANGATQNGELFPKVTLDYERDQSYSVTLRASDINNMYSDRIVVVKILDVNDMIPQFALRNEETGWFDASFDEGDYTGTSNPGKAIVAITAFDYDLTSPNNKIVNYTISANEFFTINQQTGMLYTQKKFDREAETFVYTVTVKVMDGAPSALNNNGLPNIGQVNVRVTINDINDNPPVFGQTNYIFVASEDIQINQIIPKAKVQATDPDSTAQLTYNIRSTANAVPFTVQRQTGDIMVAASLDYDKGEEYRKYVFEVVVDDTLYSATTTVTIEVTDVNDNRPVVTGIYMFDEFEEENPNDIGVIAKINATDIDNDNVNTFYYRLSFPNPEDSQYFGIGYTSGELSIIKQLDRDYPNGKAEFQFMVVVADNPEDSGNALLGYGDVTVKPKDINDNAPFLVLDELVMRVMENQPIGTLVGRVKAEDYDYKENGTVNIAVLEMRPDNVFSLNNNTLDLYTTAKLDRETIDTYYVVVKLTDNGEKPLSSTGTLTINVGDMNDNQPYFEQSYRFKLSEHQTSGEIGRIEAIDKDIGVNANITYTIATKDAIHFQMDQDRQLNMGVLKIYVPVDYDDPSQRIFNVTAYAVDPSPGLNNENRAETYIIVEVSDYNDEVPVFVESEKSVSVPENTPVGYVLAMFNATDKDVDPEYGSFKYYIQRLSDVDRRFEINQIDTIGNVSIQNLLDRETAAEHEVKILAIDNVNGSPQNTGTATLIVTVTDVNDNFPDFAANYQPNLSENKVFKDYSVITLSAVDADDENMDHGKPFSFELVCSQEGGSSQCSTKFRLDFIPGGDNNRGTATIYVSGEFDREKEKVVVLPIKMCDLYNKNRPQEQQCGFRYLNVGIQNENDNGINEGSQYITVFNYKGLFGGIEIGLVNTNDPDDPDESDSQSLKQYTLENPDIAGKFVLLDFDTGKISLQPKVPEMSFEIRVSVKDLVHNNLIKISTVRITIIFVDDDAVYNAGSIRIEGVTAEDFITKPKSSGGSAVLGLSMMEKIRTKFAEKLYGSNSQANVENVQILSIMGYDTYTDVLVAAHGSPYYQRSRMEGIVASDRQGFNELLMTDGVGSGTIDMVPIDMCQFESCEGGCFNELIVLQTPKLVSTYGASYVGVNTRVNGTCGCRAKTFPSEIECTPGYCYHGGECEKDPWNVVSCKCPDGFEGPRCQKLRQSFNGTGYALYRPFEQCEQSRTSIEVLPSKPNGLILYNGPVADLTPSDPRDFIVLELVGGHPRLRIDHGTGELSLSITGPNRLNDGVWHRIDIYREKKNIRMVIDHCVNSKRDDRADCEATGVTKGENIYINAADPLQLGGRMSAPSYPASVTTEKFDGCMKNLIHNAEIYDLSTGGQFPGATDGCQKEDDACSKSCNHGQCMITGGVPGNVVGECICEPGYRSSDSQNCDTETSVKDFGSQSFMNWNIKNTYVPFLDNKKMEITFHFRSRDNNGLIFYVTDETDGNKYIKFMIVNSRLLVVFNLGDDRYELPLSHVPQVNDGQWHKVTLERYGKQFILKMDSGEGRYYADTLGPINGAELFKVRQDQVYAGASLSYSGTDVTIIGDDFNSSCMNDIRYDDAWFPMTVAEGSASLIATVNKNQNTKDECVRNDCTDFKCPDPFVCRPLWEAFDCVCPEHYTLQNGVCINYCEAVEPCFQGTCTFNAFPAPGEDPFTCVCPAPWFGPLCQCHPSLNPGGAACVTETEEEQSTAMAGGIIAAIILGILFIIVVVFIIAYLLMRRNKSETKEPFDDDMDDDIRENVMYYDEEGAGEEDQTQYDLSRLRKPDDGEHPSTWDAPDIPISTKPLGAAADRPDVGDFISNRLNDADDDPSSPPYDTPHDFNFEGGSSDAGSLSSLNTSSTGSQDYDYLNEWGPKFAKLADMYNNFDDTE